VPARAAWTAKVSEQLSRAITAVTLMMLLSILLLLTANLLIRRGRLKPTWT
jgi:hypothetical protein